MDTKTVNSENRLVILGGYSSPRTAYNRNYRGTDRRRPTYCDSAGRDDEVNQLFFWYLEEGGEAGVVRDEARAIRYAEILTGCVGEQFEVIEAIVGSEQPIAGRAFLGYDLSFRRGTSLLTSALRVMPPLQETPREILLAHISSVYSVELNIFGLFDSLEKAVSCIKVMDAMQRLFPGTYEGTDSLEGYDVTAIFAV